MNKALKKLKFFRQPKVTAVTLGIVLALAITGGYYFIRERGNKVAIDNSLISAPIVNISPLTPGKLTEVYVNEGDTVKKNDPVALIGTDVLRADSDGLIIMTNKQIGGIISAQSPAAALIDPANLRVAGTIDEDKGLNKIKVGQPVSFTVDALPGKTFWGYIDEVAPSAKQTQMSFSISSERPTQQFEVDARFNASQYPEIKNGMSAKMTILTKLP